MSDRERLPYSVLEDRLLVAEARLAEVRETITRQSETIEALSAQVRRLGQCVDCGEMDEQNGVRKDGEFLCTPCGWRRVTAGGVSRREG